MRKRVSTLNKHTHILITILLISSTSALYYTDNPSREDQVNSELPSFSGVSLDKETDTVKLESMSTRQKVALMIVSTSYESEIDDSKILGGVHLSAAKSKEEFKDRIENYKENRKIKPLITVDLEGCVTPADSFKDFKPFREINTPEEAFESGKRQAEFLSDIGVDINFSPVVDLEDSIWNCRSFPGNHTEVSGKACAYIRGLQTESILATAKHYPGRTLTGKDPHDEMKKVEVKRSDLAPFYSAMDCGVDAVMPSHQIANGYVETDGKPADVSSSTRENIRERGFEGLIVSDAIDMGGLTKYYKSDRKRYVDVFRTNDLILNVIGDVNDTKEIIETVSEAVKEGELDERYIDRSVIRLMKARGLNVEIEDGKTEEAWQIGEN